MATADTSVLDDFINGFQTQVDSGFGLLGGDVATVFSTLVVISVSSSTLIIVLSDHEEITPAFIRKILLVGFFSWLITSWHTLTTTIVEGFASLGLKAGSGSTSLTDLMSSPSKVVAGGFKDAFALVGYIGALSQEGLGLGFFSHFDVILIASLAAVGIIIAFIILGVEVAVTIIEFHIVTLIAFVTLPFGVLTHTAYLAERALQYTAAVGVKLMALALIVSIGERIFDLYLVSATPTASEECGLLLSSILMLVLALKVPSIASALVSGTPQLSSGSASSAAAMATMGVVRGALAARSAAAGVAGEVSESAAKIRSARAAAGPPSTAGLSREDALQD